MAKTQYDQPPLQGKILLLAGARARESLVAAPYRDERDPLCLQNSGHHFDDLVQGEDRSIAQLVVRLEPRSEARIGDLVAALQGTFSPLPSGL